MPLLNSSARLRAFAAAVLLAAGLGVVKSLDPLQEGLTGRYFFSVESRDVPVHTQIDAPPSTDRLAAAWNPPVPHTFSATWEGSLLVLSSGRYSFATISDDGSHVYVDGTLVVDNGGAHPPTQRMGSVTLQRGVHAIAVDYDQRGAGYRLDLLWSRGDHPLQTLPAWVLGTRRVGVVHFVASASAWRALTGARWLVLVMLAVLAAPLAMRLFEPVRRALARDGTWSALRWILLGSLCLNLVGIWWGLPGNWPAAEITPKQVLQGLAQHFSHGWFDTYPPFHFYLLATIIALVRALGAIGLLDLAGERGYFLFYLASRLVSVLFAGGIVIAACLVGTRAFGRRAGLFGAAVLALTAPFVYYAKTANTDVPYVFWFAVSMVFYLRILDALRVRDFIWFALTAALAVCTKDQAYGLYLLMPAPILERLWRAHRQAGARQALFRSVLDARLWMAALTAAVAFGLCHNLLFNLSGFREHVGYIVGPGSEKFQIFDATTRGRVALLRLTLWLIQQSLGWPFTVAAVAGVAVAASSRELRTISIWLAVPVLSYYLGFIDVILYNYDRFVLPICFLLAPFAGLALDRLAGVDAGRWRRAVAAGAVAYTFLYATTVDVLMARDSRYGVETWLASRVQPSDMVASTFPFEYLPRLDGFRYTEIGSVDELRRQQPAFYVLNADYARCMPADSPTSALVGGLERGVLGYERVLVARRPSPWPWLIGGHHDLVGPRLETRVSTILRNINPTIEVFARTRK